MMVQRHSEALGSEAARLHYGSNGKGIWKGGKQGEGPAKDNCIIALISGLVQPLFAAQARMWLFYT